MDDATLTTTAPRHPLILASRVEDAPVYNRAGERMGHVADLSIDKVSGRVIYAIMSFGGFLGMGESYHPLPWATLTYDTSQDGYVVDLDKQKLEGAPTYDNNDGFNWTPEYGRKVDSFYNVPSYWM